MVDLYVITFPYQPVHCRRRWKSFCRRLKTRW